MEGYKVYIKTDENSNVTAINSSAFIPDVSGWIEIDQGIGDRYHHAQGNYLEKGLVDEYGRYNYRYAGGRVQEIPESEKPPVPRTAPVSSPWYWWLRTPLAGSSSSARRVYSDGTLFATRNAITQNAGFLTK